MSTHAPWSSPVESLLESGPTPSCDVLVIGSGYGGSIAAAELAAPGRSVWVVERGKEYALGEFPQDIGQLPGNVRVQRPRRDALGRADALFDLRVGEGGSVLVASGLGGGSLINAGVAHLPPAGYFARRDAWPAEVADRAQEYEGACVEVQSLLGAEAFPGAQGLAKFQALDQLAASMRTQARPVPITVAGGDRPADASHPVPRAACRRCGNCFTGCNYGAKNTLATNRIPVAVAKGARFFTGGTATRISPLQSNEEGWRYVVRFRLTPCLEQDAWLDIRARVVILSAGSLGSTELLARSRTDRFGFSTQLGAGFSTNGDGIAMGWGQQRPVRAFSDRGHPDPSEPPSDVGPTITGSFGVEVDTPSGPRQVTVQDGAVPAALRDAAVVLGSTLSLFHRFVDDAPAVFGPGEDWIATPAKLAKHAQLLLVMGQDDATGQLEFDQGRLEVHWPKHNGKPGELARGVHEALVRARGRGGFDGGDYLPNPAWRPLPDDFGEMDQAGLQPGRQITVHPLGGCCMAADASRGVVDARGAVYSATEGTAVHEGLHVLDGSILPCAPGVNPLVTISAVSLQLARQIATTLGGRAADGVFDPPPQQLSVETPATPPAPLVLRFQERLRGPAQLPPPWLAQLLQQRGFDPETLGSWVAVVEIHMGLGEWLADPSTELDAEVALWPSELMSRAEPPTDWQADPPLLRGDGKVQLLAPDAPGPWWRPEGLSRLAEAARTFLARRGTGEFNDYRQLLRIQSLWRAAVMQSTYRYLGYRFASLADAQGNAVARLSGSKRLAYRRDEQPIWQALIELPLQLQRLDPPGAPYPMGLEVDVADLIVGNRLQVSSETSTPAAMVGLAALAAQWTRALLQSHFWSFQGLDYRKLQQPPAPRPAAGPHITTHPLAVDPDHGIVLQLHHHRPAVPREGRCVLMIHGLAHGSGVFTTDTVDQNMADYFLMHGYQVWLLDHRLSNLLPHASRNHTIDEVAAVDIREAVDFVFERNGEDPIDVFAHCVGAAAFSMAVLQGHINAQRKVRSAILHAVHPWVVPSTTNRVSAALAAFYKDLLPSGQRIDPLPPARAEDRKLIDQLIDRLGASLAWPPQEQELHAADAGGPMPGTAVCNRMTLFYGREWVHQQLDPRTHARLHELVGAGGLEVFRQLFFMAMRERLTNRNGENVYLQKDLILQRWTFPTLFAHGSKNSVFDVRSAVRSWNRMRLTQLKRDAGQPPVASRVYVQQGYGHMDFLFGRHAAREIFPRLQSFFEDREGFRSRVGDRQDLDLDVEYLDPRDPIWLDGEDVADHDASIPLVPVCGPLLQVEGGAGVERRLVIWLEQRVDTTSPPSPPLLRVNGRVILPVRPPSRLEHGPAGGGCYWLAEVTEADLGMRFSDIRELQLTLQHERPGILPPQRAGNVYLDDSPHRIDVFAFEGGNVEDLELPPTLRPGAGTVAHVVNEAVIAPPGLWEDMPAERPADPDPLSQWQKIDVLQLPWWQRWVADEASPVAVSISFLAASCRWPGIAVERKAVDALALAMAPHLQDARPAQALVLLGDQVYIDATADMADITEPGERGPQRYRDSWAADSATGRLLARLPCWMVVDDHEFGDNLAGPISEGKPWDQLKFGFESVRAYQWRWHRAAIPQLPEQPGPASRGFWHSFTLGGVPAFAADTRTERQGRATGGWTAAGMLGQEQFSALCAWLLQHRHETKILCSGSVFGLPTRDHVAHPQSWRCSDEWTGYPATWAALVEFIVKEDIRNLVFLAGDYHLVAVAELTLHAGGGSARALSVACSAWNATLPFANAPLHRFITGRSCLLRGSSVQQQDVAVQSRATVLSTAARQFAKLTVAGAVLRVEVFGPDPSAAALAAEEFQLGP